jgi:ribonuclease Z
MDRLTFPVEIAEVVAGEAMVRKGYAIAPFPVDHGPSLSLGYALVEEERRGRFHPDLARGLGIPEGPLWGLLHRGERVTLDDGRVIDPAALIGAPRPGRRVVISGDTRPCEMTVEIAHEADLLVHEATFAEEEAARALETGHSTAAEAARVAERAGVRQLVLTHLSARYSRDFAELEREARAIFPNVSVARDGTEVEVGYRGEVDEPASQIESRSAGG